MPLFGRKKENYTFQNDEPKSNKRDIAHNESIQSQITQINYQIQECAIQMELSVRDGLIALGLQNQTFANKCSSQANQWRENMDGLRKQKSQLEKQLR